MHFQKKTEISGQNSNRLQWNVWTSASGTRDAHFAVDRIVWNPLEKKLWTIKDFMYFLSFFVFFFLYHIFRSIKTQSIFFFTFGFFFYIYKTFSWNKNDYKWFSRMIFKNSIIFLNYTASIVLKIVIQYVWGYYKNLLSGKRKYTQVNPGLPNISRIILV